MLILRRIEMYFSTHSLLKKWRMIHYGSTDRPDGKDSRGPFRCFIILILFGERFNGNETLK